VLGVGVSYSGNNRQQKNSNRSMITQEKFSSIFKKYYILEKSLEIAAIESS
jgi:hypothetical protein